MLHITQKDWGLYDLAWDAVDADPKTQAQLHAQEVLESAVYTALFTDAATDLAERVPAAKDRQGWWHNPDVGSSLWHLRRQPLSDAARREAVAEVQARLSGYDPALTDVTVSVVGTAAAGSVSGLYVQVSAQHNGTQATLSIPLL